MSDDAYEPLLSSDETEALLHAMRNGAGQKESAKEIELGSPDQRLRHRLTKADEVARDWAAEVRRILRRMLGVSASVRETSSDVVPYNVIAQSIEPGTAICSLRTSDGAQGFLLLGTGLTSFVIHRRLGGSVAMQEGAAENARTALSAVDRRIVRPFCDEVVTAFAVHWGNQELSLTIEELIARPIDLPRLPQFEPLLRVGLSVSLGVESSEELSLVLSGDAIRAQQATEVELPDPVRPIDRTRLVARLALAELELVAVLGRAQSSVRSVLALSVGDVIRLDEPLSSPVQVYVEGQKQMLAAPVVSHGNVAVEIVQLLKGMP